MVMLEICLALGAGISKSWSELMALCCSLLPASRKLGKIFPKLCEAICIVRRYPNLHA